MASRNGTGRRPNFSRTPGHTGATGDGIAATGGSDTHYLPTLGSTYTLFQGETAQDLRDAIETGATRAGGRVYSPFRIFNVINDLVSKRLPVRTVSREHTEGWPLSVRKNKKI